MQVISALSLTSVFLIVPLIASAEPLGIDAEVASCRADPQYRVGGAAMGECLLHKSNIVDQAIAELLKSQTSRFCAPQDRRVLAATQEKFVAYRVAQCGLVERSPGNTASHVNGAACTLMAGKQRMEDLRFLAEYTNPICTR